MAPRFPDWLASLGTRRADLLKEKGAVRGLPVSHTLSYPGDVTDATLEAALKASPDSAPELAAFTVGAPTYDAGTGKTTWPLSLTGVQTGALPADNDANGTEYVIYDAILTLSGLGPDRIAGGLFEVSGFVTEPA